MDKKSKERKDTPLFSGCLAYFPDALDAVARLSKRGNDKHNPGQPMHHARGKSTDHGDCILRHQKDYDEWDEDNDCYHAVAVAWRALAQAQELLEWKLGLPVARGARNPVPPVSSPRNGVVVSASPQATTNEDRAAALELIRNAPKTTPEQLADRNERFRVVKDMQEMDSFGCFFDDLVEVEVEDWGCISNCGMLCNACDRHVKKEGR